MTLLNTNIHSLCKNHICTMKIHKSRAPVKSDILTEYEKQNAEIYFI